MAKKKSDPKATVGTKAVTKTVEELLKKNPTYTEMVSSWNFWLLIYRGGKEFVDYIIQKHERESETNLTARRNEACVFNYCKLLVDLFSYYLTEKQPVRELAGLTSDKQWVMFMDDADLFGTNFDVFINDMQKVASVAGMTGILVDKPTGAYQVKAQEIDDSVYPYCASYNPLNIFDWTYERNAAGKYELTYLKLVDLDNKIRIWTKQMWAVFRLPDGVKLDSSNQYNETLVTAESSGDNPLGEIPFVWMYNVRDTVNPLLGTSDLSEIAPIVSSIVRNLSYGEEIIKYGAFPMLQEPDYGDAGAESVVGVRAVKTFDPEFPNAKAEWMESQVLEPITAIIQWIDKKIDAIFELAHIGGLHSGTKSEEARSGISLRYEYQQLASVLTKKGHNMNEAELSIIYLWLKWQGKEDLFDKIRVTRATDFSIDDLTQNLEELRKGMKEILSKTFRKRAQSYMVKKLLPLLMETDVKTIETEIDQSVEAMPVVPVKKEEGPAKEEEDLPPE